MSKPTEHNALQQRFGHRARTQRTDAKSSGFGRVIIVIYGVFSLSAGVRSLYQLGTEFSLAPFAIILSTISAAIYVIATVALSKSGPGWHRIAWLAVWTEMIGVLAVGLLSVMAPGLFPKASVWSHFGAGYGYVPLVLPVIGLIWLWRTRPNHSNG
ncbi:hypothetical protein IEE91_09070 [Kocuria sp. cx-455]|uniref:hypothetical protein n=1 Tax=unclassified Candidatus Sulfotelmatobacter TaxID=2635724 RepID=UPI0016864EA1|nr:MULTISPECIES: hypothetical protein [unclassified Candidatus Sulfotelmatobacter]MBD2762623.1 hypothetical protein [Kocuria sp. cx-116]MBD2765331.1 hypothetical protein [Kocuria sp. cx-455]